jgi:carboxyl-terminal processing protease
MSRSFVAVCRTRRARVALCGLILAACSTVVLLVERGSLADPVGPQQADRQVTVAVSTLLKREHLSRHPLDSEISERWLKTYLKTLDAFKVYFMQTDIDEFDQQKDNLVVWAKQGDIRYGYTIFQKFLERVDERVKLVDQLLAENHDFTVDEEMITDPDLATYAKTPAEVREVWRKRIKYDLLLLKADKDKIEGKAAQEKLSRRYHSFAKRMHQTDSDELLEMYLTALTTSYDPHTTYMSPGSLENFEIQMRLNLEGIGAALQSTDGYTVVSKVIPGGAADKDGRLKPEDKVIGVGQDGEGEIVDVVDMKLNDVVKLIRGKRGTVVRLKVIPASQTDPKTYAITRAQIELVDSEARSEIVETGQKADGTPFKVGVIDLPSFYMDMSGAREGLEEFKSTTRDVAKLLKKFNDEKVDVVVLNLRENGGGSLTESINLTGLFIDTGPVVQVKDADKKVQHYDDQERGMSWSGPLVVLTSKFSASASEIFAGAIQDYHRGLILGDYSTHGKGTVQSLLDLGRQLFRVPNAPQLGALKITMQQFYRPNGDSTQNRGVVADIELPSITSQLDVGESSLDYAVKFDHVDPVPYHSYEKINSEMIGELKTNSAKRRDGSKDWEKVAKNIARYNDQKKRKRVSLNENVFMAERAEINADKEEEKELEKLSNPNKPVFDVKNYYSQEILAVAVDYLKALQKPRTATVGRR